MSTPEELPAIIRDDTCHGVEYCRRSVAVALVDKLRAELEVAQKLAADRLEQMQADRAQALKWRDECESLKVDAERWRACERSFLFPEFCGHDTGSPTGRSWYMPTAPLRDPPIFQAAGEAVDEHIKHQALCASLTKMHHQTKDDS